MARRRHIKLRHLMEEHDILQTDLADITGRRLNYITDRMTGTRPWTIQDIYNICDYFNGLSPDTIPYDHIHEYFPLMGVS